MIETTHIPLAKAAEMLGTDETTLLIAAAERRLQLYWLLNEDTNLRCEGLADSGMEGEMKYCYYLMFIPMPPRAAASIIQGRTVDYHYFDDGEDLWAMDIGDGGAWDLPPDRNLVFAKREDIQAIISNGLPKENTIPDVQASVPYNPRQNTLLATVAALVACFPPGKVPSGKELERNSELVGVKVTDDAIRKVISEVVAKGKFPAGMIPD